MKLQVNVSISLISKNAADSLYAALEPDNIGFPEGVLFNINKNHNRIDFSLSSENDLKLLSTVDDILESTQAAIDTLIKVGAN